MLDTYTVKQVADILGYSTNSIYSFLKENRIKGVRVGRGRIRITEEELRGLLKLSKKSQAAPAVQPVLADGALTPQSAPMRLGEDVLAIESEQRALGGLSLSRIVEHANFFDWFVATSSVLTGFALFIFNLTTTNASFAIYFQFVPILRVILITAGLGMLMSDDQSKTRGWHRFFHVVLSMATLAMGLLFWYSDDPGGVVFHISVGMITGLMALVHLGGIVAFGILLTILAFAAPVIAFLLPGDPVVHILTDLLHVSPQICAMILLTIAITFLLTFWIGRRVAPALLWFASFVAAIAAIVTAYWFGNLVYWSRAFTYMNIASFAFFVPVWQSIQFTRSRRQHDLLHVMFLIIFIVMMISVYSVGIIQRVVWDESSREFQNKVTYGVALVEETISTIKNSIKANRDNLEILKAVAAADAESLQVFSKSLFESNPHIRRVVFLDGTGNPLSLYPPGISDSSNYSQRDYFLQARDTGDIFVSRVFQAKVDNAARQAIAISVPLIEKDDHFIGVMVAYVDLDKVGYKLQQVAVGKQGEYFTLTDKNGQIIIDPRNERIGQVMPASDPMMLGVESKSGVAQTRLSSGSLGMVAYGQVPTLGWAISLRTQVSGLFMYLQVAVIGIFTMITLTILGAYVFITTVRIRVHASAGASGP